MPRFRSSIRPVNRIKHVFDEQGGITAGVTQNVNLIIAVDAPVLAQTNQVITGSVINSIFLIIEVNATTSAALANAYVLIQKNPSNTLGAITPNAVGSDNEKRFVIHQEMVMLQQVTNSNPRTLFKGVIKIPRGYRRFGPDDRLNARILAPGVNINYCVQCHYKEYR